MLTGKGTILIIEDVPELAAAQVKAVNSLYPEKNVIHVTNMEDAVDILRDDDIVVEGILTDNGYPLSPDGKVINTKDESGGAGVLLIKQLREGSHGKRYRKIRVAWHAEQFAKDVVDQLMECDGDLGRTYCFKQGKTEKSYLEMAQKLRPTFNG